LASISSALFFIEAKDRLRISMGSDKSVYVLTLLKEKSVLKELDNEYEAGTKTQVERDAHQERQQRHQGIANEIKALAGEKKHDEQQAELSDSWGSDENSKYGRWVRPRTCWVKTILRQILSRLTTQPSFVELLFSPNVLFETPQSSSGLLLTSYVSQEPRPLSLLPALVAILSEPSPISPVAPLPFCAVTLRI
jgi:hypothetical protein